MLSNSKKISPTLARLFVAHEINQASRNVTSVACWRGKISRALNLSCMSRASFQTFINNNNSSHSSNSSEANWKVSSHVVCKKFPTQIDADQPLWDYETRFTEALKTTILTKYHSIMIPTLDQLAAIGAYFQIPRAIGIKLQTNYAKTLFQGGATPRDKLRK